MTGRSFVPLSMRDLMEKLHLPEQHQIIFRQVLAALVEDGTAKLKDGKYSWKESHADVFKGIIRMHMRGFGFVTAASPATLSQDIFIPKHLTQNAVDGDTVEVLINPQSYSEKGPEGRVIAILNRGRTHIAGIVKQVDKKGRALAYVPMLGVAQRVIIETDERELRVGDRLVMEVIDWGEKETETHCRMSHYLGHISDPSIDTKAAIEEYELRADFPQEVIDEARAFGDTVPPEEIENREDLRHLETFTIDPTTAKDFDDALSLTKKDGKYHLAVHIADVSHYVGHGSALDAEAKARANSTYFPRFCLPMLPKELSDNLCSLKADVERLTVSVLVTLDSKGELAEYRIARTIIKSDKRFSYREAKEVLDGKRESPHKDTLNLMVELCLLLKEQRRKRGSIEFSMPELRIVIDNDGVPTGTEYIEYDITHQLVEEFMLKANETIAHHLSDAGRNLAYRVHDTPAEENISDFVDLARAFGFECPDSPSPAELQKLFDNATSTPYGQYLANCYIRRMRLAAYSPENIGHYGLSLSHYCHFTSPIRRYADLVVHRILFGDNDDWDHLLEITDHCSKQERISAKAEMSVNLLKKLRLLDSENKKQPNKDYEAVVTSVKPFGITVEVLEYMIDAFIHVSEIGDEFFDFDQRIQAIVGTSTNTTYCAGDLVTVMLRDIDFILLESKWELIPNEAPEKKIRKPKRRRK